MKYQVRHLTQYDYSAPVSLCYNRAHLIPRDTQTQHCLDHQIKITPEPAYQRGGKDYFENFTLYFSIEEPHSTLAIEVISDIERRPIDTSQWLPFQELTCGQLRQTLSQADSPELRLAQEYLFDSTHIHRSPLLQQYCEDIFADDRPVIAALQQLTEKIFHEFTFDASATNVATPIEQVLQQRSGVCQDFAHLAIGCLRSVGIPARYISGYLETLPPPGEEKLVGADASHAWFAAFIPELGWLEFDPTNNILPDEQHLTTAWGRDYADVTPLQGVIFDGGDSQYMSVSVDVKRLDD
ncbi:transglutaminase family protein [Reinekea thalattae]|uniref:Transglutaminase family protein n=1 Tax=Reinekea thalattae TaxID=2593301 RepID=A0A5C8ZAI7_9GAMM|nr:transglutaminase family protein [Reinekea thalattae]TXR54208.1 transglutaminase family protein [Reinekea thalattae]